MSESATFAQAAASGNAPRADALKNAGAGYAGFSWVFFLAALGFLAAGIYRMYVYDDPGDKVVGADAYNYIILGIRGAGLIGAGCLSALLGVFLAAMSVYERLGVDR